MSFYSCLLASISFSVVSQCFVGAITPSENPNFYLKCLDYVYQAYLNLPTPRPPLIVNTMGWTQGKLNFFLTEN